MIKDEIFNKALKFVLKWEGGFVNDPDDRGGATNKGVTQRVYDGYRQHKNLPIQSVKLITNDEVAELYYNNYWLKAGCNNMSKVFAVLAFDTAINMGVGRVSGFLKAAEYKDPDKFIEARKNKYIEFSNAITGYVVDEITRKKKPVYSQRKFLNGWLNRLNDLKKFVKAL